MPKNALLPRATVLFLGDIFFFGLSLWLSLYLRSFELPDRELLFAYTLPFAFLAFFWVAVFFVAGLYESRSLVLARRTFSTTLLIAQVCNVLVAALFFFLVPVFGVTPKTILFIYLVVSFILVLAWRAFIFPWLRVQSSVSVIVIGQGSDIDALVGALSGAPHTSVRITSVIRPSNGSVAHAVRSVVEKNNIQLIIADFSDERISAAFPEIYTYLSRGIRFIDAMDVYEELFGRVALSQLNETWLAKNISRYSHVLYDPLKRAMDTIGGAVLGLISLLMYPFVMLAIYIEDGRPFFISQDRVGENNQLVRIYKFRTMTGNDNGVYGAMGSSQLRVTFVGGFLRAWRIDELPQLWNVIRGDLSLIGPRLEFPSLVSQYEANIPYYGVRHLIKPGLSGWAQLYYHADPHHAADVEATKMKLSYDLYYLKHRSLALDLIILLKTVRRLLIRGNA